MTQKIKFPKETTLKQAIDTIKKCRATEITRILIKDKYIQFEINTK